MKRLILPLLLVLMLAACRTQVEIRPDTIVDIPLNPTFPNQVTEPAVETAPQSSTEASEETQAPEPTQPPTEKPAKKPLKETIAPTEKPTQPPTEPPTHPPTQAPTLPVIRDYVPTALDRAIVEAINTLRAEAGLSPLVPADPLSTVAAIRCSELAIDWKHTRPDGSPFTTALTEAGLDFSSAAELIYGTAGIPDARTFVEKWMSSDSHRESLLMASAVSIGTANLEFDGITAVTVLIVE